MYYLHDKREKGEAVRTTADRVAWTHTHNLPTDDPEKAMKWMAYTSMNSDKLKEKAGVSKCGRKATAGSVYSFSLAWHPDQEPQQQEMTDASLSTLEKLGLGDHQAVFVAHQETDHKHVHIICNLVHPVTGKTAKISHDRIALSEWAEEYERGHGKIYCEQRVENNQKRRELSEEKVKLKRQEEQHKHKAGERSSKPKTGIVKHREERLERAAVIQDLYERSDCGKSFKAALQEQGYTLARGDRRGFVIVDRDGKIHSLSRQLEGQRAKDLRKRLSDLDDLKTLEKIKQHRQQEEAKMKQQQEIYDREADEVRRQKELSDAAMRSAQSSDVRTQSTKAKSAKKQKSLNKQFDQETKPKVERRTLANDAVSLAHQQTKEWQERMERQEDLFLREQEKRDRLEKFYGRKELNTKIEKLSEAMGKKPSLIDFFKGTRRRQEQELETLKQQLETANQRILEAMGDDSRDQQVAANDPRPIPEVKRPGNGLDKDQERLKKLAAYEQRMKDHRDKKVERNDLDIGR